MKYHIEKNSIQETLVIPLFEERCRRDGIYLYVRCFGAL